MQLAKGGPELGCPRFSLALKDFRLALLVGMARLVSQMLCCESLRRPVHGGTPI